MNWEINVDHDEEEQWKNKSIYKVQRWVSDLNKNAFKPQVVSFGPYHHEDEHLKAMESHKERAVNQFLKRSEQSLETIYNSLSEVVQSLKYNYDSLGEYYDNDKFLKMMILDGCFLIEILRAWTNPAYRNGYSENDPIFSEYGIRHNMQLIRRDMLLLENQVPMMVLDKLIPGGIENANGVGQHINQLIFNFCRAGPSLINPFLNNNLGKCLHVLDVVRKNMIGEGEGRPPKENYRDHESTTMHAQLNDNIMLSAFKLKEAGVQFKRSSDSPQSLRDISFQGGVLSLPALIITNATTTKSMFLNLMAFESCHVGAGNAITSYICFMDSLVMNDEKDISLLLSKGIILNELGISNNDAANLLHTISAKDLIFSSIYNTHLVDVRLKMSRYYRNRWNMFRAYLVHKYYKLFTSRWALISIIAATMLFALTLIQTVCSIMDCHKKK